MFNLTKSISNALLIKMCTTITINDCNLVFSEFFLVRRTTCPAQFFSANDNLDGTATAYGTYGSDCNYGIPFNQYPYNRVLITTVDKTKWIIARKT